MLKTVRLYIKIYYNSDHKFVQTKQSITIRTTNLCKQNMASFLIYSQTDMLLQEKKKFKYLKCKRSRRRLHTKRSLSNT